jgi:tRNA nucleotidyltransferase (CCA-adding enzyme)
MEPSLISEEKIHRGALSVCRLLHASGFQAFIVGGCVRDLLLGLTPKDWDICTDATPQQVMGCFPKTIPTGLQHGTVTVCPFGTEDHFEVTTFRVEGEYVDGRRPEGVEFVLNVEEDLARRDLTINAMAYDPVAGNILVDPFGGLRDLQAGIIRAVGNPNDRFQEDGLRIMRAARFAARFGCNIEENTFAGMKANLATLKKVSKERISDELCKILMSEYNGHGMMLLLETDVLGVVCPLLKDASVTTLKKLYQCNGELETHLAILYSLCPTSAVKNELTELKLSTKEINRVIFLLSGRPAFTDLQHTSSVVSYRRFIARFKNEAPDLWSHTLEQFILFGRATGIPVSMLDLYREVTVPARKDLAINGNDLMEIGIPAGPNLKYLLDSSYSEIMEHPEHNRKDYLLGVIKKRM